MLGKNAMTKTIIKKTVLLFVLLAIFATLFPAPAIVAPTLVRVAPGGAYVGRFCGGETVTILRQSDAYYKVQGWSICEDYSVWTVGFVPKFKVKFIIESPKIPRR